VSRERQIRARGARRREASRLEGMWPVHVGRSRDAPGSSASRETAGEGGALFSEGATGRRGPPRAPCADFNPSGERERAQDGRGGRGRRGLRRPVSARGGESLSGSSAASYPRIQIAMFI